jgi:hypothetical protein
LSLDRRRQNDADSNQIDNHQQGKYPAHRALLCIARRRAS